MQHIIVNRPVVCYNCALRFSTIPISAVMGAAPQPAASTADGGDAAPAPAVAVQRGNLLPPPSHEAVIAAAKKDDGINSSKVLLVSNYHPFFDVAYAITPTTESRRPDISNVTLPVGFGNRMGRTYLLSDGLSAQVGMEEAPICIACRGVSQYMDSYYADAVEEAVRTSPYHIDSTHITLFVNVPRAFSFSWATVAAMFVKSAVVFGGGRGAVGGALCGLIPEEYASFKDMYTPDMRARIVSRLSKTVTSESTSNIGAKRSRDASDGHDAASSSSMGTPYITRGFEYCHQDENSAVSNSAVAAATAAMIRQAEAEGNGGEGVEAAVKAAVASSSTVLSSPTLPDPSTILVEVDIRHFLLEMLTGETPLESLHAVHACMTAAPPTSSNVSDEKGEGEEEEEMEMIAATAHLSHGARGHGDGESSSSVLPRDFCTNKGTGGGFTPLPGFVIDDYVVPFLVKNDLSSPWGTSLSPSTSTPTTTNTGTATTPAPSTMQAILNAISELQKVNEGNADTTATSMDANKFYVTHLSVTDSLSSVMDITPIQIYHPTTSTTTNTSPTQIITATRPAAVIVNVRHSSVLLIGKYTKFLRGMSQSPWFCDGARIGGSSMGDDTGDNMEGTADGKLHSLQETVANPLLEMFFPAQMQPVVTAPGNEETEPTTRLPIVAPGGTNAARDVSTRHAQVIAHYWASSSSKVADTATTSAQPLSDRIIPIIYRAAAAAEAIAEERTAKQQSLRTIKQMHNQPRGNTTAAVGANAATAEVEKTAPAYTKYLSTPIRGIDPVLTGMSQVKGFGHYKFHTAGREDVDVRMLGTGRPFVLEVLSPERCNFTVEELRGMEEVVNRVDGDSAVHIHGLAYTNAAVTVALSKHSSEKKKAYRCVAWSSRRMPIDPHSPKDAPRYADPLIDKLHAMTDIVVKQTTPLRVLHRRSLLARDKIIHSVKVTPINEHWMVVDMETQAGTYVKEFVHGDCGRTLPNLGSLLDSRTDIIQLDVLGMSHLATEC